MRNSGGKVRTVDTRHVKNSTEPGHKLKHVLQAKISSVVYKILIAITTFEKL